MRVTDGKMHPSQILSGTWLPSSESRLPCCLSAHLHNGESDQLEEYIYEHERPPKPVRYDSGRTSGFCVATQVASPCVGSLRCVFVHARIFDQPYYFISTFRPGEKNIYMRATDGKIQLAQI